ncbi:MAG: hypothetical protein WA783_16810 [Phormidesmis sp.]
MDRLISVLGTVALIIVGLYVAVIALDIGMEIFESFIGWLRYDVMPGLIWIGILIAGAWIILGLVNRRGMFR